MPETVLRENSLVLYRTRPARVQRADEKLTLELEGGESARVRAKDVALLHPGPMKNLAELRPPAGDVRTAWEILAGSATTLAELAELAYGAFTPSTAWAAWELVTDALYFRGTPDRIVACSEQEVAHTQAARAADAAEKQGWEAFVARAKAGKVVPEDQRYLREVEELALGRAERSRVLRALGREESGENAHAALLEFGCWDETVNPYPVRYGLNLKPPALALPEPWTDPALAMLADERRDLTHLPAFAIDDAWTDTPDDAVSFDPADGRLWVHVADAAALVAPDSPLDLEARARATSLYLPEAVVPMLPEAATPALGLGLTGVSPALSFALAVDAEGELTGVEVVPSLVRVRRLSYEEAEGLLDEEPFSTIYALGATSAARRQRAGALSVEMPEASVRVRDGEVSITPIPQLRSRDLVQQAMILAGEAAARFGTARGIPLPFATQEPPDLVDDPDEEGLAAMFARRRTFRRSQYRSVPAPHSGLGLNAYAQATSPMRRYLDLVVHQQLRAYLAGRPLLNPEQILVRIGAVEAALPGIRPAEQFAERHWIMVHLLRHPGWRGRGVLVDKRARNGTFIIPELGLEPQVRLSAELPLDSEVILSLRSVDLPRLEARFRVETAG
jgi:exoribonuclease-2